MFTSLYGRGWGVDCDEVVAGLYIGDKAAISNTAFLTKQQITHVLNAAEGRDEGEPDCQLGIFLSVSNYPLIYELFCADTVNTRDTADSSIYRVPGDGYRH